jgi:membrane protease subunit HflC
MIKGDGDAKAMKIYSKAYSADPEFYAFYRTLKAYEASFTNKNDLLVLNPNGKFFKYLK